MHALTEGLENNYKKLNMCASPHQLLDLTLLCQEAGAI